MNKDVYIEAFAWFDSFNESCGYLSNILEIGDMRKELVLTKWIAIIGETDQCTNFIVFIYMDTCVN